MRRFYANENFPLPVVKALRRFGHEVITTADAGRSGYAIPDDQVLDFAIERQLTVLTINRRDFIRLHNSSASHWGIIVCTFDRDFEGQAMRIHEAVSPLATLAGQLIRVNRKH